MWSLTNQFRLHPWQGGYVLFWRLLESIVISLRHILCVELQPLQLPIPTSHYLRFWRWLTGLLHLHFRSFITNLFTAQLLHMLFFIETFCNFILTIHWAYKQLMTLRFQLSNLMMLWWITSPSPYWLCQLCSIFVMTLKSFKLFDSVCLLLAPSFCVELYLMFSHIFRTEFV